jgi:hypothetical protein
VGNDVGRNHRHGGATSVHLTGLAAGIDGGHIVNFLPGLEIDVA